MRRGLRGAMLLAMLAGAGCAVANRMSGVSQARELERTGRPATATIVGIWDTGMTVNDDPVVGFELEVTPPEGEPWRARAKQRVSRLAVPAVQPGARVAVYYDPADPSRVSLALASTGVR